MRLSGFALTFLFVSGTSLRLVASFSLAAPGIRNRTGRCPNSLVPFAKYDEDSDNYSTQKVDTITKASWYAVESFGKLFGSSGERDSSGDRVDANGLTSLAPPASIAETVTRLQQDNERLYFLSGKMDVEIYDSNCVFADPFVSFEGRDRFVANLQNLGSFISNYSAKPLNYSVDEETTVTTKFMVKLELNLPWRPVLAWPWGVKVSINPATYLITRHEEMWDIEAWEVRARPATILRQMSIHLRGSYYASSLNRTSGGEI
jgi:Uncharacterized conserved protein (DUF2358)